MENNFEAIGICPECGASLMRKGTSNTIGFRLGTGTMYINATYDYCPRCGLNEEEIDKFQNALDENINKILLTMRKEKYGNSN